MTETDYEHITHNGTKILVDAAIRDGEGYQISTAYPRKVDILAKPGTNRTIHISHGLGKAPSAVSLYQVHGNVESGFSYERIEADMTVTDDAITITFIELPPADPTSGELELLVRSLI